MMKLKRLLKDIPGIQVKGSKDISVAGICSNSKLISPGYLFIAKKGIDDNGARYIPEAIEAGASAILTDMYDPSLKNVVQLIHSNAGKIEAALAAEYYRHPSDELFMAGITGTNGKTTTSFLIKHLLDACHGPCGLIGTIEYIIGNYRHQAARTTPDVIENHKMLREMITQGCRSAVMEVSSHGLMQGRVENIDYDVAIFSNLSLDHLDYHESMENYCAAKNRLFRSLAQPVVKKKKKVAIINADSPWLAGIIEGCQTPQISYGIENQSDLRASNITLGSSGTRADVSYMGQTVSCSWPLIGRFNVYNYLSAMAVGLFRGLSLCEIAEKMAEAPFVRGRLEFVKNELDLKIFVDFAHSDDALSNVLETLTELKSGRIITVFGCGGDRDRSKRSKMAAVSERYSDFTIVTSDNPRSENPDAIHQDILKGFQRQDSYAVEPDRRAAIQKAVQMAMVDDIILIAGKGHETYQIFAHKTVEFDDVQVATEVCAEVLQSTLIKGVSR
jgi:UDP-N-acetylmuramoyl-L-alanyl-D-glutamate--2,6-diaminopimelate ligase